MSRAPLIPLFRTIALAGGAIYLFLFGVTGSAVIHDGSVVWRADFLLQFEVVFWFILCMTYTWMAAREVATRL